MKKILSAALSISMLASLLAFSASADTPALVSAEDIAVMSVEQIAYLDVETAAPAVQDAILEARSEIIYGDQAWTVDGAVTVFNIKTGTVTELPEFSDLYPGWDIPELELCPVRYAESMAVSTKASGLNKSFNCSLVVASAFEASQDFYDFNGRDCEVGAYAATGPRDARYNLGFSNTSTKQAMGWVPGLQINEGAKIYTESSDHYGVRASAADTNSVGQYRMYVTDDPNTIGGFHNA